MSYETERTILDLLYARALALVDDADAASQLAYAFSPVQRQHLETILTNAERRKGVLTVLLTSLLKKVADPAQDVRQHQENLPNGYSGRSLDTAVLTPFLRNHSLPYMAESGWLTRSLEQNHAYDTQYPGKITPPLLGEAFLTLLDDIEQDATRATPYILHILAELERVRRANGALPIAVLSADVSRSLSVSTVLDLLRQHFFTTYPTGVSGAARLPVLAVYAAYQCLIDEVTRYAGKVLLPLESHTTADSKSGSIGDIEIDDVADNQTRTPYEGVEIKFQKPITLDMIQVAYTKIRQTSVQRYYILSTKDVREDEREAIKAFVRTVKESDGYEIIVNGVIPTLTYYLRLINDPGTFINYYSANVQTDVVLKAEHRQKWQGIIAHIGPH